MVATNVFWNEGKVMKEHRSKLLGYNNKVLWFTGLSGSGKSTIAREVEKKLHGKGILCYVLDGDNIRHGLNKDLGFSVEERDENIRRITEVVKLFYDAGIFVLVSFISPYKEVRNKARECIGEDFVEVFVDCSLEECEKRDVKGLYKKARSGEIKNFTGVNAPYEAPDNPDVEVITDNLSVDESVLKIYNTIKQKLKI